MTKALRWSGGLSVPYIFGGYMVCYHPMHGYMRQDVNGRRFTMSTPKSGGDYRPQTVPCGQCVGCRLSRSRQWAVRCMHEASLYSRNCFITLTYAPEHLPYGSNLVYDDFQKFMKRLRFSAIGHDAVVVDNILTYPIRFYMAGEYGSENGRPHFHACIFNYDFPDKIKFMSSPSGKIIYRSKLLESLWPYGFSSIGDVTFQSAAYVARYIMKKVNGTRAESHYEFVEPSTGEVIVRSPEFNKMSLKPGIGARWFEKFQSDVFPHDYVIVNGRPTKVPRYYDNLYKVKDPFGFDDLYFKRLDELNKYVDHSTPDRLKVKESIAISRLKRLKRTL